MDAMNEEIIEETGKPRKRFRWGLFFSVLIILAVIAASGVLFIYLPYTESMAEYEAALDAETRAEISFEKAAEQVSEANEELEASIDLINRVIGLGGAPLDPATLDAAKAAVEKAESALVPVPGISDVIGQTGDFTPGIRDIKGIIAQTALLNKYTELLGNASSALGTPDYSEVTALLEQAQKDLEDSIDLRVKITDPNAQSVISALKSVSGIISAEAATEDNDPFAMLGTEDGYTSCIFFGSDLVPAELPEEEAAEEPDENAEGENAPDEEAAEPEAEAPKALTTEAGGAIEVYESAELAESRDEALTKTANADFHTVFGSMVIRLSPKLSAIQQQELLEAIEAALLK